MSGFIANETSYLLLSPMSAIIDYTGVNTYWLLHYTTLLLFILLLSIFV